MCKSLLYREIADFDHLFSGVRFTQMYYISYLWILPQRKISAYKNISLLDRLAYCEPPPFGGEAMWQDAPIIITD